MSEKSNLVIIGVSVLVLGLVGGAYVNVLTGDDEASTTWADPDNAQLVERGSAIYAQTCAECHGDKLQGQPDWRVKNPDGTLPAPPHDETGHTWHHPDNLLFDTIKYGGQKNAPQGFTSGMLPYEDVLSDEEIMASLAYIKSRWPEEIRKRHAQMSQRMKAK
jgi:S-disulfanyl-L-cysteine oxidoreductase SoxD